MDKYAGEYILLQQGEVRWHDPVSDLRASRRKLAGDRPDEALWLKYVDPEEREGEYFGVYDHALQTGGNERIINLQLPSVCSA